MAHILCITTGLTGITHASFELVSQLEAAGHRVTYASPWDVRQKVTAQGFTYVQLPPTQYLGAADLQFSGRWAKVRKIWAKLVTASQRRQAAIAALGTQDFDQILHNINPDLILCDSELPAHIMTAVSLQMSTCILPSSKCDSRMVGRFTNSFWRPSGRDFFQRISLPKGICHAAMADSQLRKR